MRVYCYGYLLMYAQYTVLRGNKEALWGTDKWQMTITLVARHAYWTSLKGVEDFVGGISKNAVTILVARKDISEQR